MKIALAVLNPNILSGGNKFTSDLRQILEKLDHKVALCCWERPTDQAFDGLHDVEDVYTSSWISNQVKGTLWRTILTSGSSIKMCVNDFNPDLVITADLEPGVFCYIPDNVCKVHYCHFPTETKVSGMSLKHLIYRTPYWYQHYKQLARLDYVVCNSRYTENIAKIFWKQHLVKGSFTTIYPSVDINQFKIQEDRLNQICYIGRISREKGIDYILDSFVDLSKNNKCNLKIVGGISQDKGSISYAEKITKRVGELKKELYPVEIKTNVPYSEIINTLASSKVLLSYNPEEHFGIVPVEAQAAGCVPIVADGGGQQETVMHNVTGFRVSGPGELQKYVKQVLSDDSLYQRMSEQGRLWAKRFSMEETEQRWNSLLTEIGEKRRGD